MTAGFTAEEKSKNAVFQRIALIGEKLIAAHGRDFTTGGFVLAARWISEGRLGAKIQSKAEQGGEQRPN